MAATIDTPVRQKPDTSTRAEPGDSGSRKPRWATAAGSTDDFCHWYLNRSRTLCGIVHEELPRNMMHREAPCPNGCPPCPLCVAEFRDGS